MDGGTGGGGHEGTKQAPNVKPKVGQDDWSGKPEHRKRSRRSRSTDSEREGRGRRRERERSHRERQRRGRSEEARGKDGKEVGDDRGRAPPTGDNLEDTECAVCFSSYDNVFKTPKLLACGHTFCLECLARINVTSPELKELSCPVCRGVTELRHGRDLPRLGNNQDVIGRLPPQMQRALSVRFKRNKGKLVLKNPPPKSPTKPGKHTKSPSPHSSGADGDLQLSTMEQGAVPATVVDVGRPPSRVQGRIRRLFRSDRCYYAVVAAIITIIVALMLVGLLAFVIIPNITNNRPQTQPRPPPDRPRP
ncbi:E3 ubiquitin-protein ligase RNF183 [Pholidichthys leucotaenia]